MFSTTLLVFDNFDNFKFLTTFIMCAQVRTGAHRCAQVCTSAHTHYSDMNSTGWETTWKHVFHHFATCLQVFDNFHNFWILCAQVRTVRTGAHKCAHTLFRHKFNWETTWKHVFHHFATCLQVFDNFHNFWILCAQVRTGAHRCAQVRTHTIQT